MSADVSRDLGRLEGMVESLVDDSRQARSDRKLQYERFEKIERSIERVEGKLDGQAKRIEEVEAPIKNFARWRERFIGMGMIWTVVSGVVGATASYYWQKIVALITG